jgi:hypothetical protein
MPPMSSACSSISPVWSLSRHCPERTGLRPLARRCHSVAFDAGDAAQTLFELGADFGAWLLVELRVWQLVANRGAAPTPRTERRNECRGFRVAVARHAHMNSIWMLSGSRMINVA